MVAIIIMALITMMVMMMTMMHTHPNDIMVLTVVATHFSRQLPMANLDT